MNITIDTTVPLSDNEKAALRALIGDAVDAAPAAPAVAVAAAPAKKATPAKKAAAAPKPDPEPEPEPEVAEEEQAEEPDEDLVGGATMADAVKLATELVSSGEAAKVKAALSEVGAKRVSELKESDIATFISSLS